MISAIDAGSDGLEVCLDGGRPTFFSWAWLRDHGEDEASLDPDTLQRRVNTFSLPPELSGRAEVVDDGRALRITWNDGAPDSRCSGRLLASVIDTDDAPRPRLWAGAAEVSDTAGPVPCEALMADDDVLCGWLDQLRAVGFAMVDGVAADEAAATALAERISRPRTTVFGTVWRLSSEMADHQDSAYTTTFLEPHTDSTYMTDAPGTQLFCCVERTGTGGESILVDGFAAAETLRAQHPEAFALLTAVSVPGRYVEPGVHLAASRPAIRLDDHGRVVQVSFNNYDRAPFWLPEPRMSAFYEAYSLFHGLITDTSRWFDVRLEPGMAVLFDNWRVLHGRHAYTGRRVFHGCYHDRDEIESRRRVLRS